MYKLLATFCSLLFILTGFAQNGSLSGRVIDKKTGDPAIGAIIKLENTSLGAAADLDGKYTIKNIPAGDYTISVSIMSYDKISEPVTITAGKNTEWNGILVSSVVAKKEVVITKKRKQESLTALTVIQKNSLVVADGISSDIIKKSPDKNTGDVIKRVSGASLQDGKFAIVRGLADRYNNAMLNSTLLSSTEADRKAFSFDLVPSFAIDNLMIYKTASADMSGDFAGGIIQITTKDIPEEKSNVLSLSANYNGLTTFKNFESQQGDMKNIFGLTNGNRNLIDNFPVDNKFNKLTSAEKYEWTKKMPNTFEPDIMTAFPGASLQYANSWNVKKEKYALGSIFSVNYSNSFRTTPSTRASYNAIAEQEYAADENIYRHNVGLGGIWNIGLKFGKNSKLSLLNLFNNSAESQVIDRIASDKTTNDKISQIIQQFTKNTLQSHQLSGEHCIGPKCYRLKYQAGLNILQKELPDLRRTFYSYDITNPDDTVYSASANFSPDVRSGGRLYSSLLEHSFYGGADMSMPFQLFGHKQIFKFGFYEQVKLRTFNTTILGYVISNFSQFNDQVRDLPVSQIFDTANIGPKGYVLRETYNPEDRYRATSNQTAGFMMFDNKFTDHWRLSWGVRIEQFGQELFTPYTGLDTTKKDTLLTRHIYIDVLPSINLIYSLNDNSNFRFSVSKTLSRPEFRELSRFRFYDYTSNATIEGNPDLRRTNIYNADLRYEIFQKFGQMFTVSAFFKYFVDPIEQTVDFTGPETRVKSFVNAKSAINYGFETEFRLKFSTIFRKPESVLLNSFLLTFNAALIYSQVKFEDSLSYILPRPLQGQSPYVINSSLQYQHPEKGWGASIFYNIIGDRISEVGNDAAGKPNVIERNRNVIDLQVSKSISKKSDLKLTVSDILAESSQYYLKFRDQNDLRKTFIDTRNAPTITFSFSYKF